MRGMSQEEGKLLAEIHERWQLAMGVSDDDERAEWLAPLRTAQHELHRRLSGPRMSEAELRAVRTRMLEGLHQVAER